MHPLKNVYPLEQNFDQERKKKIKLTPQEIKFSLSRMPDFKIVLLISPGAKKKKLGIIL